MTKSELTAILKAVGVSPSKKMGQNFLIDSNFLDWIVRESGACPGKKIIEVGPGFGALTRRMMDCGATVSAVEFDHRIAEWLRSTLCPKGLNLLEGDACKVNLASIYGEGVPYSLVSNLPYSAGTVVVANLLDSKNPPPEMLIMLQKEVAMRLAAGEKDDEYGALSVRARGGYTMEVLKIAPPEMFFPRPEVDSCVIRLTRRPDIPSYEFRQKLSQVARLAFSQRRKKMIKQLAGVFTRELMDRCYLDLNIPENSRAEQLPPEKFVEITEYLLQHLPA